jgi:hypothetical protein
LPCLCQTGARWAIGWARTGSARLCILVQSCAVFQIGPLPQSEGNFVQNCAVLGTICGVPASAKRSQNVRRAGWHQFAKRTQFGPGMRWFQISKNSLPAGHDSFEIRMGLIAEGGNSSSSL